MFFFAFGIPKVKVKKACFSLYHFVVLRSYERQRNLLFRNAYRVSYQFVSCFVLFLFFFQKTYVCVSVRDS